MNDSGINWENDTVKALTFALSGETFALEASLVCEILDILPETTVPGSAPIASSVINFRGSVIPVADLRLAFGLVQDRTTLDSRFIVIELACSGETCLIGIKADKVFEVTTLQRSATELPPRIGTHWRQDFIRCLAKRSGEFIVVPNLPRIFATCCQGANPTSTQH